MLHPLPRARGRRWLVTREEAARAFAEKMGWEVEWGHLIRGAGELTITAFYRKVTDDGHVEPEDEIEFPAPDAPLHEHLAFVGRVAEAIGSAFPFVATAAPAYMNPRAIEYSVGFGDPGIPTSVVYTRPDLCHAALLAALAALEAR